MLEYLLNHAKENVWCTPFQDYQVILDLHRLTINGGVYGNTDVAWDDIVLPTEKDRYAIYQIGQNRPFRIGFPDTQWRWTSLAYWGDRYNAIIDFYHLNGQHIPTFQAYVMRTEDLNFLVAVKLDAAHYDLDHERLFLRVYRNSFWNSSRSDHYTSRVEYAGGRVTSQSHRAELAADIKLLRQEPGVVNVFLNGNWVDEIPADRVRVGDNIEFVHDAAVARIVDFRLSTLLDYYSELDKTRKYLLHPPKELDPTIRYRDDVDVYLYKKDAKGRLIGRYFIRNAEMSLRMITHNDYGIPVSMIRNYLNNPDDKWATLDDDIYIRLHIRDSGWKRPLVNEHHRIKELYKLDDKSILRAMLGLDATLDEWNVVNLEQSSYTAIMRDWFAKFTYEDVVDAYGYNAIAKLVADSPRQVIDNGTFRYVEMGQGQLRSTVFELNENGRLLGYYLHEGDERYYVRNDSCTLVEVVVGHGAQDMGMVTGNDDYQLTTDYQYRFYCCTKKNGVPSLEYRLAVFGTDYQIDDNMKLTWIYNKNGMHGLIVPNSSFLLYETTYQSPYDTYYLTIQEGTQLGVPMPITMDHLAIWVWDKDEGNYALMIEGLDFYVNWPNVMVVSPRWLQLGVDNKFIIRGIGAPKDPKVHKLPSDVGFVNQGWMSVNDRYDIRDDKVMHVIVDGGIRDPKLQCYMENYPDQTGLQVHRNGAPYQSGVTYAPLVGLTQEEQDSIQAIDEDLDSRLEDWLTVQHPQQQLSGPNPLSDRLRIYSPLIARLIADVNDGILSVPYKPENFEDVEKAMKNYKWYLPFEPATVGYNENYVLYLPHPYSQVVEVTELMYRFLTAVNKYYLKNRLQLTGHFMIKDSV